VTSSSSGQPSVSQGLRFCMVLCMCEAQKAGNETVLSSCYLVMFINLNFKVIFKTVYDLYAFYNTWF
jgi:hypothetical protein